MNKKYPCNFDHNGECLVCNCSYELCAYDRWKNKDYKYETEEELDKMFEMYDSRRVFIKYFSNGLPPEVLNKVKNYELTIVLNFEDGTLDSEKLETQNKLSLHLTGEESLGYTLSYNTYKRLEEDAAKKEQ